MAEVVGELVVRQGHALGSLGRSVLGLSSVGDCVQRRRLVLGVSDALQEGVRHFLVAGEGWVVRRCVAGQLGEVL